MLANDIYHDSKRGFDPKAGLMNHQPYALESERNLVEKYPMALSAGMIQLNMNQAVMPGPVPPVPYKQELEENSCFYSCCPV